MLRWLDAVPFSALVVFAVLLGLAPFYPHPHVMEKAKMLFSGTLKRPLDIFDLLFHLSPLLLLALKAFSR